MPLMWVKKDELVEKFGNKNKGQYNKCIDLSAVIGNSLLLYTQECVDSKIRIQPYHHLLQVSVVFLKRISPNLALYLSLVSLHSPPQNRIGPRL